MHPLVFLGLFSSFCFASASSTAVPLPPLGYWITYHHSDPSSVIEMKQSPSGAYYGVVVAGLYHGESHPEAYCTECNDETWTGKYGIRKDEKVLGKSVLWNFQQEGDVWTHGYIIRVKSGNLFDASFSLTDDNKALNMKINAGFFKKTVTWVAISEDKLRQYCTRKEAYHENGKTMAIECVDALTQEEKPVLSSGVDASTSADTSLDVNDSAADNNSTQAGSSANTNANIEDKNNPQADATDNPANTNASTEDKNNPQADATDSPANTNASTEDTNTPQADATDSPANTNASTEYNNNPQADATDSPANTNASTEDTNTPQADATDSPANTNASTEDNNNPQADATDSSAGTHSSPIDSPVSTNTSTADIHAAPQPTAKKGAQPNATTTQTGLVTSHKKPAATLSSVAAPNGNTNTTTINKEPSSQPNSTKTASCASHGHHAGDGTADAAEPKDSQDPSSDTDTADSQSSAAQPNATQPAHTP